MQGGAGGGSSHPSSGGVARFVEAGYPLDRYVVWSVIGMGHAVNPEIFRQYDIRGLVERDLTDSAVRDIGRAVATMVRNRRGGEVVVGRDCRLSSPSIHSRLVEGLRAGGVDVTSIGVCPTPVLYFALHQRRPAGGVMITGSHNPPEFNGFKVCVGTEPIHGDDIQKIKQIIEARMFAAGNGRYREAEIIPLYQEYLAARVQLARSVSLAVDAGNGTGGQVAVPLMGRLDCRVTTLYCEMDGRFPHHHPDPTVEANMEDLRRVVTGDRLELGVGYDGDADRLGVIDDKGRILWGDKLLALFARRILREHTGATVIGEVKCSQVVYDDIKAHAGVPLMWKTGHSLIRQKMRETGALLAGEMSGHIFFRDRYFGYDDAMYASLRLLEVVSSAEVPLSEIMSDLPVTYATPEIRVDCPDDEKFRIVQAVTGSFAKHHDVVTVDGVRVTFPDGWGLLRASNTQPVLVLRFEALSEGRLAAIKNLFRKELDPYGLEIP